MTFECIYYLKTHVSKKSFHTIHCKLNTQYRTSEKLQLTMEGAIPNFTDIIQNS